MLNVLFLCHSSQDATSFYRAGGVSADLARRTGHNIVVANWKDIEVHWQTLSEFNVVLLQRPFSKESAGLCQVIKNLGLKLWVDYDDNLFAVNPENDTYLLYSDPKTQANIKQILTLADVVSVTCEYLRQTYIEYNKNIKVIPNAFNDLLIKRGEIAKRERNVIWRGGANHIYDLMKHGAAINQLTSEHPDFRFLFWGYYAWFLSDAQNKGYISPTDPTLYFQKLFKLFPAVMHVPLNDDPFNRCRSNTAYIESAFSGAVCVCPSWWNVPGSLSYSDPQSYYDAIKSALTGKIDVVGMAKESWEYVSDCLMLSKINEKRANLLKTLE
jgi:hypothetical protein